MKHVDPAALPVQFRRDARTTRELIDQAERHAKAGKHAAALQAYKDAYRESRQLPDRDLEIEIALLLARYQFERGHLDAAQDWLATHCILLVDEVGIREGDIVSGNGITFHFVTTASLHEPGAETIKVYRDFSDTWKNPFVLEAMADEIHPFGAQFLPAKELLLAIRTASTPE